MSLSCHFDVNNVISLSFRKWLGKMYYTDSDRSVFLSSELMTKMTQKKQRHIVSLTMACHFAMINRNEVKMSKISLTLFPPKGTDYFPSTEGFISCRQATFQTVTYMRISVKCHYRVISMSIMSSVCHFVNGWEKCIMLILTAVCFYPRS